MTLNSSSSSLTDNVRVDFDDRDLATGSIITDQYDGIEISTSSEFGVMLFDTGNITGEDFDLKSDDLGNVLIISEDGDSSDPDDNAAGGIINLDFDDLVTVDSIGLLDIDESGSAIAFYDEDSNLIKTVEIANLGENSFQEIDFDIENVASVEIDLAGSGAVTGIDFSPAQANSYSNIYVFGDSLVDTGNVFNLSSAAGIPAIPPSPPYFEGRFSNGQIWIDDLAEGLNLELTPATELSFISPDSDILSPVTIIDGNPVISPFFNGNTIDRSVNFGYGGATTGASGAGELGSFTPGVESQVEFFVADHLQADRAADEDALYVFWAGSNDYFDGNRDPQEVVNNIESEIESLYDLGGRDFLILNLPDLALLPEANNPNLPASPEELSQLSDTHNLFLDSTVNELEDSLTGANITLLDVNSLLDDVAANPEEFDLTNVTDPFLDPLTFTPTAGANPDEYFFYDTLHPTEAGHSIISDFALETLSVEAEI